MATYNIAHGAVGVQKVTSVAATVDTVVFDRACAQVTVETNGADDLYITVDGSTPTVGGANTHRLMSGVIARLIFEVPGYATTTVKLISTNPVVYSVEGDE